MEFLKLDEDLDETKFKEDWQAFFYGAGKEKTDKPQRGFFNFYPVQKAKTGSIVVAPLRRPVGQAEGQTRCIPTWSPESRATSPGGSGSAAPRHTASASTARPITSASGRHWSATPPPRARGRLTKAIRLELGKRTTSRTARRGGGQIDGADGSPLRLAGDGKPPEITLKMPPGVSEKRSSSRSRWPPVPGPATAGSPTVPGEIARRV